MLPDDAPAAIRAEVLAGSVRSAEHRRDAVPRRSARAARRAAAAVDSGRARERAHAHYMLARALLVAERHDGEAEAELVGAPRSPPRPATTRSPRRSPCSTGPTSSPPPAGSAEVVAAADASAERLRASGWARSRTPR